MGHSLAGTVTPERRTVRWVAALATIGILTAGVAAWAAPANTEPPRPVVLARSDNPVDALSASAVAAAMGGIVLLTPPDSLHPQARDGIREFDPAVVWLAGGEVALSADVEQQVSAMGYRTLRIAGEDRQETARKLGQQLTHYGVGRPLFTNAGTDGSVTGPQGDAALDGSFDADELTVGGDPVMSGLTTVSANAVVYPDQGRASATADCPEGTRALSGSADLLAFVPRDDIALQSNGRTEHHDGFRDTRWIATWSYDPTAGNFPPARLTVFCVAA